MEPTPDTPGQAQIREQHEQDLLEEHGEEGMRQTAAFRRAEWEFVKWTFLDTDEAMANDLSM